MIYIREAKCDDIISASRRDLEHTLAHDEAAVATTTEEEHDAPLLRFPFLYYR